MRKRAVLPAMSTVLLLAGLFALMLTFLYFNARPESYDLEIGTISAYDITAQQDVANRRTTEARAQEAASRVGQIHTRSPEISDQALAGLGRFFDKTDDVRLRLEEESSQIRYPSQPGEPGGAALPEGSEPAAGTEAGGGQETKGPQYLSPAQITAAAQVLTEELAAEEGVALSQENAAILVSLENSVYSALKRQTQDMASGIMAEGNDTAALASRISSRVASLVNSVEFYKAEYAAAGDILRLYLRPNVVYDEAATLAARTAEYERVLSNPDIIPAGTRILNVGDTVTPEIFEQLEELNLIEDDSVDWRLLMSLFLLLVMVYLLALVYLGYYERQYRVTQAGDRAVLLLSLALPFILSAYMSTISPLAVPVYFASIIITIYFGLRTGVVMSLVLILAVMPMTFMSTNYLFTALLGSLLASYLAAGYRRRDSQFWIILLTALGPAMASLTYGLLARHGWQQVLDNSLISLLSGGLSAVAAIGIMPVFETLVSSVSPVTLIQLAQPSQPLLRRLFLEAPGTNQHSMMVANLAEAAAETIGADAMLCRVGSYYHDIGKLEHPEMFTENQDGFNIHDTLEPEESVRYIIGHVAAGLKTARRYRLPLPIQKIITEHHGNTLQASFYHAAAEKAKEAGLPPPDPDEYRYPWHIPTSKESGIVMLADSLEAAMRSTRTDTIEGTEQLARKIIKIKTEQDQMTESGLSFAEVEKIIKSFIQVYQGQFHERVRYPDANPSTEPAAQVPQGRDRAPESSHQQGADGSVAQN